MSSISFTLEEESICLHGTQTADGVEVRDEEGIGRPVPEIGKAAPARRRHQREASPGARREVARAEDRAADDREVGAPRRRSHRGRAGDRPVAARVVGAAAAGDHARTVRARHAVADRLSHLSWAISGSRPVSREATFRLEA